MSSIGLEWKIWAGKLSCFVERHKLVFLNTMVYCMRDNILSPYNTCRQHQRPCVDQPDSHMCYIRLYDYKYTAFVTRYISIQPIVIFQTAWCKNMTWAFPWFPTHSLGQIQAELELFKPKIGGSDLELLFNSQFQF